MRGGKFRPNGFGKDAAQCVFVKGDIFHAENTIYPCITEGFGKTGFGLFKRNIVKVNAHLTALTPA
jgi:hypothetical protein